MRLNDEQLGKPETIYKGTKAAIEAAFATEGMHAWATDTHEQGYYDGTNWVWGGGAGASSLHDLTDVDDTGKANGDSLVYNGTSGKWEPTVPAGGGDVLGPATSVDEHLAVWDGTDSKTLKDGGAVPSGGSGSVLEVQVFS